MSEPSKSLGPGEQLTPLEEEAIVSEHSPALGKMFEELGISLVVSTYQAGKLVVVRADNGVLTTHFKNSKRPMGIAAAPGQMAVGLLGEIMFYTDVKGNCARLEPPEKHDACYVPRYAHLTGEIDIHEMAFGGDGQIWFINTRYSTLCTLHGNNSFYPVWRPPFITDYAPEDRCHLNGLGMLNGQPRYVTALGETDKAAGWRDRKADGGVLIDLATNRVLSRGLSMPHSPRWYDNQLWVCESGKGTLSKVDYVTGEVKTFAEFPGFTRGLDFFGPLAIVGLSEVRESATFSGIPIAESKERNCGLWMVDIRTGQLVGTLRFTQGAHEIFAVQVLPQTRFPEVLGRYEPLALRTYFLAPEHVSEIRKSPSAATVVADSRAKSE